MNPFFFGSSDEPLFGVFHPPASVEERSSGVVLCYPAGQEYMRAHRAFRQLALLLSRAGFAVLRFDFYGTGDSAGDSHDATVERWISDIGTACDELKELASVDRVALVGLRLGGTLASYAAASRTDISSLVLWDAVVSGKDHLHSMLQQGSTVPAAPATIDAPQAGTIDVMGFAVSDELGRGIAALDPLSVQLSGETEALIVVSKESDEQRLLSESFQRTANTSTLLCVPSDGNWNEVDDFGSVLIPQAVIRRIVLFLSEKVHA